MQIGVDSFVAATVDAATAVAAVVQRNCRRDSAGDGLQAPQEQDIMASSRVSVSCARMLALLRGRFQHM